MKQMTDRVGQFLKLVMAVAIIGLFGAGKTEAAVALYNVDFSGDSSGSVPTVGDPDTTSTGTTTIPQSLYQGTGNTILVQDNYTDATTHSIFASSQPGGKVAVMSDASDSDSFFMRFDGYYANAQSTGSSNIQWKMMLGNVPGATGFMFLSLTNLEGGQTIGGIGMNVSSGQLYLLEYTTSGGAVDPVPVASLLLGTTLTFNLNIDFSTGIQTLNYSDGVTTGSIGGSFANDTDFRGANFASTNPGIMDVVVTDYEVSAVPEPSSLSLSISAVILGGIILIRRRNSGVTAIGASLTRGF